MDLSSQKAPARPAGAAHQGQTLGAGTALGGGRYTIVRAVSSGLFAAHYEATDADGNAVSLHLLAPALSRSDDVVARVEEDARAAAAIDHTGVAKIREFVAGDVHSYLVTDAVDGNSLRQLLERKRVAAGAAEVGFGVKGTLGIIGHVCSALTASHISAAHGTLTLDNIAVSRSGRVSVFNFALAAAAPLLAAAGQLPPSVAPEVAAGGPATAASDVYSIGAVLYELLIGVPPIKGCKRPSEALPGIPPAFDAVIARSMAPQPAKRFSSPDELRQAMLTAIGQGSGTHESQRASASSSAVGPSAGGSLAESIAVARASVQMAVPGAASTGGASGPGATARAPLPRSDALTAAISDTDERWLISKGKLDYGPFTLAKIAEQIESDQILPGNIIIDKDTGSRTKVDEHPLLDELVQAAAMRRDELRRAQAEVHHASTERRRGAALYVFIALGVLALGLGAYFLVTKLSADKRERTGAIEGLEGGSLQAKISFPTADEQNRRVRARGKRGGGGGAGGVAGGWDDSMDLDMSADGSGDGGSERLRDSDVNPVIQRHGGGLGRCLTSTSTRNANIEFIVKPTGRVSQVRVNGQTGSAVANCIRGVMTKMQFPTFNGVRSKHYFDIGY